MHTCKYDLAGSVIKSLKLKEILPNLDGDIELMHGPTNGSEELRTGVSQLYSNLDKENVLIVNGTTEGNFLAMSWLLEPGDEMILGGVPTYLQGAGLAEALGARVKYFRLDEEQDYRINVDSLNRLVSRKTKAIMIISPNNPTGSRFSAEEVRGICEVAEDANAYVLADEVLRHTELDGTPSLSPSEIYERGISTGGLSKLGLAGLRTGWLVAERELVKGIWAQKDYTTLANPILSDHVAAIALQKDNIRRIVRRAREICEENWRVFSGWLAKHRHVLKCVTPLAGAVAFPRYELDVDSVEFCKRLMKEKDVMLTPGDYFMAPKHFRIQYAGTDAKTLEEALGLFSEFLTGFGSGG